MDVSHTVFKVPGHTVFKVPGYELSIDINDATSNNPHCDLSLGSGFTDKGKAKGSANVELNNLTVFDLSNIITQMVYVFGTVANQEELEKFQKKMDIKLIRGLSFNIRNPRKSK